jgi:hypothetical protein
LADAGGAVPATVAAIIKAAQARGDLAHRID